MMVVELTVSMHDLRRVGLVAGSQIYQWIHRGFFSGLDPAGPGNPRRFPLLTGLEICVMSELARFGLSPDGAKTHAQYAVNARENGRHILVVWDGPAVGESDGIDSEESTANTEPETHAPRREATRIGKALLRSGMVSAAELTIMLTDPWKRGLLVINLEAIEKQLRVSAVPRHAPADGLAVEPWAQNSSCGISSTSTP
jgi:hypothetical protein